MTTLRFKRALSLLAALFLLALPIGPAQHVLAAPTAPASIVLSVPAQSAAITITKHPGSVRRNSQATISVRAKPNASCTMAVHYKSGPSKAAGVGTKKADASGIVSWSWKVGGNTTKGTWPVSVTCGSASISTSVTVP